MLNLLIGFSFLLPLIGIAAVGGFSGDKQIFLVDKEGEKVSIGRGSCTPINMSANEADNITDLEHRYRYQLFINYQRFTDYFLSMKEMKCLQGPELWCHLACQYEQPQRVARQDLSWLSHNLLFMFKPRVSFGANFWNGIYYDLDFNGDVIMGCAQALDLNLLAALPDDLMAPPLLNEERAYIDSAGRWLPTLIIR